MVLKLVPLEVLGAVDQLLIDGNGLGMPIAHKMTGCTCVILVIWLGI